ncbi:MAG: ATP-binding cassette domain-containing protein [Candidatus Saccharimonadales bacterium]
MAKPIVKVADFNLTLGGKSIVRDMNFEVQPGEVFAFLGANGSGKTSTIRSLLGIYRPTSGHLHVNGEQYGPHMSDIVGYLPEERGLYTRSKVIDTMTYFGELKGMTRAAAKEFSHDYLKRVDLDHLATTKVKKLSGGQQQKVQLGVAIMNDPKLLILDEPTKGLDPVNRVLLMDTVNELRDKGTAIIYITHLMEEVERIADRLIIIRDGERVAYGSVPEVKKEFKAKSIEEAFVALYRGDKS